MTKTYYEKVLDGLNKLEKLEEKKEYLKNIDYRQPITKDEDATIITSLRNYTEFIDMGIIKEKKDIDKLKQEGKREYTAEDKEGMKIKLQYAYEFILESLKKYVDMNEENYNLITLWIMGTYAHEDFPSYPYLFLNAMKGSGKSRLMKLIIELSKEGSMMNSLTEAVLFRSKGTLGIDEFEGIGRKGTENLKELLNSGYKKGTHVKRMRKIKKFDGEDMVVEEFDVYRPIIMANIYGLVDEALKDRCITLILEKSSDNSKINLIELFEHEKNILSAKSLLKSCSLCSVVSLLEVYQEWNNYITYIYTHTQTTQTTQTTLLNLFEKMKDSNLNGREIELCLPLFILADTVGVLDETIVTLKQIFQEKKEQEINDNLDISLYDYFSQELDSPNFVAIKEITTKFKEFIGRNDEFINERWIGRRLTTLKLIKIKKRMGNGIYIIPDYKKAQEKIGMFR